MTEQWSEYAAFASNPITSLVELNTRMLNTWTNNSKYLREILQAKNPADLIAAQTRFINSTMADAMKFAEELNKLFLGPASLAGKTFNAGKAFDTMKAFDAEKALKASKEMFTPAGMSKVMKAVKPKVKKATRKKPAKSTKRTKARKKKR